MGSINKQISRYEATAVYTHPDAKVDIVLVHGLNGDPQKTWTAKNGVFWPADLLPTSLRDARANVLVYGYNADVYSKKHGSSPSDNFIYMHAQTLVTSLTHYRKDELSSRNPIIWVCHSLGGILTKRALLYSNDLRTSQHEDYRSIYVSTYGLVFLGTPHTGSDIAAWGTVLQAMSDAVVPKSFFQSESVLLKTLKRDNETLQNINSHFLDIYQRFKILMAHENHKTDLKGTKMLVVDAASAGPQLPGVTYYAIEATHSTMCKFESKNAPGYRTVAIALREWTLDAPDVIATRWRVEEDEKLARAKHEIEERMKPWINSQRLQPSQGSNSQQNNDTAFPSSQDPSKISNSNKPLLPEPETPTDIGEEDSFPSQQSQSEHDFLREPMFVKPTVFRPNTFFKGREKEMKQLHKMLMDKKRRSIGTASVLIQSMPGGGKSHLARQYVFQHKDDYPGGVFWIRAKSLEELDYGYWDIAKAAGLSEARSLDPNELNDNRRMVKAVQSYLSSIEGWLLVLDGLHFDFPDLELYIPFAENTSIIYTSTERTPGEDYQFDNPQVLVLDPLTKREAQELLFEEMGKKQPWTQDDLRRAEELVELMDRLPLMIHVSALHLKATREPLAKYLRSYRSRPKVGNLPAYRAVREQLEHRGAHAALNLMSILAFFGTHLPVEMVALGAKALDRNTPVKTSDPSTRRHTINNTLKVLIAFALIERNENHETASASSRSSRSVDMTQDNLDILRIHGIVQAFFVDVLAEERQAPFWLERAICVFLQAFNVSDARVDKDPQMGTPEDFRRFLIHGQRLLSHLGRFEKKWHPHVPPCRDELERSLERAQARLDLLTKRYTDAASRRSGEVIASVFERSNSLSEGDSSTPPSNSSLIEGYMFDTDTEALESPTTYMPADYNPYHWHVSYPYGEPYNASNDFDNSRTITPQPPPTEIFESMTMADDDEITRKVFGPNHRTIRKHAERRYRDHAGSWRAAHQILSDPRTSISRETARGVISISPAQQKGRPRSSSDSEAAHSSEAKHSLDLIKKGSPPTILERGGTIISDIQNSLTTRPQLIMGRTSYANARTKAADDPEYPITPTFSYPPPSSKDAAATIMRLKGNGQQNTVEGLSPIKVQSNSSPLTVAPLTTTSLPTPEPSSTQLPPVPFPEEPTSDMSLRPPPGPPSRPSSGPPSRSSSRAPSRPASRSPRSSPANATAPFRPPPIPVEVNTTSSLRSSPGPGAYHWDPVHSRIDEEHDEYQHMMHSTHSLPSMPPSQTHATPYPNLGSSSHLPYPHGPQTVHVPPDDRFMAGIGVAEGDLHPPPWAAAPNLHPAGYSSQPMSRDPSHQSSTSQVSAHSNYSDRSRGSTRSNPNLAARSHPSLGAGGGGSHTHHMTMSRSASGSGSGGHHAMSYSSSPASQIMQRPRSRRPSVVETEPSPRLVASDLLDPVPMTSYQLYKDSFRDANTSGDGARGPKSSRARDGGAAMSPSASSPGSSFMQRFKSMRGRSGSRRHRRAESAGGRLDSVEAEASTGGSRPSRESKSRDKGKGKGKAVASPELPSSSAAAGGDATRSGSGGIRLADGRVVEFGSPTPEASSVGRKSLGASSMGSPPAPGPTSGRRSGSEKRSSSGGGAIGLGIHGVQQRQLS